MNLRSVKSPRGVLPMIQDPCSEEIHPGMGDPGGGAKLRLHELSCELRNHRNKLPCVRQTAGRSCLPGGRRRGQGLTCHHRRSGLCGHGGPLCKDTLEGAVPPPAGVSHPALRSRGHSLGPRAGGSHVEACGGRRCVDSTPGVTTGLELGAGGDLQADGGASRPRVGRAPWGPRGS